MCKESEELKRRPRKVKVFGFRIELPFFIMFIIGMTLSAIFLIPAVIFTPPSTI